MSYKITEVEGIGPAYAEKLASANIKNTNELLHLCCDAQGRKEMAQKTGISEANLLKWANLADLMRVSGIGRQYAELLEAAGVDTLKELRTRNPENLTSKMNEVNAAKKLTRATANTTTVGEWIVAAKKMEPRITH